MHIPFRRAAADRRGSIAVEFALVVPVLLLFMGCIVDFGRAFYYQTELNQALRSGMQYTLKAPTYTTGIVNVINQGTALPISTLPPVTFCQCLDGSNISCSSTCPAEFTPMRNHVKLETKYSYNPMFGNMGGLLPGSPLDAVLYVRIQ